MKRDKVNYKIMVKMKMRRFNYIDKMFKLELFYQNLKKKLNIKQS